MEIPESHSDKHSASKARPARWPIGFAAIALACLVWLLFFPVLDFEFIDFDVAMQVVNNDSIRGLTAENVKHILTSWCLTSYYPVRTLTYALDYQLWGLTAWGFKLTNILIHTVNVLLIFWLVLRLLRHAASGDHSIPAWWILCVATFSAGVFAVHPVVVEPVTWVAGREELLMTLGVLGCLHAYITARWLETDGNAPKRALAYRIAAALFCAMACLSNAIGAVIPSLAVAADLLLITRRQLWKILHSTAVFWIIGGATIAVKVFGDTVGIPKLLTPVAISAALQAIEFPGDQAVPIAGVFSFGRVLLVLNAYWLNLKTLVWPFGLAPLYEPVRPTSLLETGVILGGIAIGLTCLILWRVRRHRMLLLGLVWFGLALGPYSQLFPHHVNRADRFLYLPLVGLVVALGASLTTVGTLWKRRAALGGTVTAAVLSLFLLVGTSASQVRMWGNSRDVWENAARVSPKSALVHRYLAHALIEAGEFEEAFEHYETSLKIDTCDVTALNQFSRYLAACDDLRLRDYEKAIILAKWGCELTEWKNPESLSILATAYNNSAVDWTNRSDFGRAIECYNKAIETDPEYATPVFNLALLLTTCSDEQFRQLDEAVRLADRAAQMEVRPDVNRLLMLAEIYAQAGRSDDVIRMMENAIIMDQAAGNTKRAEDLRRRLDAYSKQEPSP